MVEKYGDGYEIVARTTTHLPGKITGTARLFLQLFGREPLSTVVRGTIHEFLHMASDQGEGTIGIQTHPVTGEFLGIIYRPKGDRPPEQRIKIARAVGKKNMSDRDKEAERQALREIETRNTSV